MLGAGGAAGAAGGDGGAGRLAISTGTIADVVTYVEVPPGRYCPGADAKRTPLAGVTGAAVVGIGVAEAAAD